MTVNKDLLGRQPKHLNHFVHQFVCFKFARFDFACFNFDLYVFPCLEVPRLLRQRRNSMKSLEKALGRSRAECKDFSTLRKKFCKKIQVDGLGNIATLSSTSQR